MLFLIFFKHYYFLKNNRQLQHLLFLLLFTGIIILSLVPFLGDVISTTFEELDISFDVNNNVLFSFFDNELILDKVILFLIK